MVLALADIWMIPYAGGGVNCHLSPPEKKARCGKGGRGLSSGVPRPSRYILVISISLWVLHRVTRLTRCRNPDVAMGFCQGCNIESPRCRLWCDIVSPVIISGATSNNLCKSATLYTPKCDIESPGDTSCASHHAQHESNTR